MIDIACLYTARFEIVKCTNICFNERGKKKVQQTEFNTYRRLHHNTEDALLLSNVIFVKENKIQGVRTMYG